MNYVQCLHHIITFLQCKFVHGWLQPLYAPLGLPIYYTCSNYTQMHVLTMHYSSFHSIIPFHAFILQFHSTVACICIRLIPRLHSLVPFHSFHIFIPLHVYMRLIPQFHSLVPLYSFCITLIPLFHSIISFHSFQFHLILPLH